jgi:hypothetical protein
MRHAPSARVRLCGIPPREESIYAALDPSRTAVLRHRNRIFRLMRQGRRDARISVSA